MSFNTTDCESVIIHYRQYNKLLEGCHPLELCRKSNINDDKMSLSGRKNTNKDKVKDKDKNKDKNKGFCEIEIHAKLERVKRSYINFEWGKSKDKDKVKDKKENKDENAGSSKSDVNAKSEEDKGSYVVADWIEKSDLGEISSVKLFKV